MVSLRDVLLYEAIYGDKELPKRDYPEWICTECAITNGGRFPRDHIATFHVGECGWCKKKASVSQPRDYRFPNHNKQKEGSK